MFSRYSIPSRLGGAILLTLAAACGSQKSLGPVVDLITCPPASNGGDRIDRGFYVGSFPGVSLKEVHLWLSADSAGSYDILLTAQRGSFAGALIGSATATVTLNGNLADTAQVTFDFGGRSVPKGSVVAFSLDAVSGPGGTVYYVVQTTNSACPVTETEGTSPPLDVDRRAGIGVRITGSES